MKHAITAFFAIGFLAISPIVASAQQGYQFTTSPATNITQTSATISGFSSGSVTQTWVEINVGNGNVVRLGQINGAGQVSGTASNLQCNTTYFFQAAGMVSGGMTNGSPLSFRTLACGGNTGGAVQITSFTASPTQVENGGSSTLSWTSVNATSCTVDGSIAATNGSRSVGPLFGTRSYTISCLGQNGSSDSRTLSISVNQQQQNPVRIDYFNASPTQVENGGYTTLTWGSTNATSCSISNEGTVSTNGTRSVGPIYGSRTFTLTCTGAQGSSDSRSVTVSVNQQQNPVQITSFTASPTQVQNGGYTTLSWSTINAISCSISSEGTVSANGSRSVGPIYGTRSFTLSCIGNTGGSDSRTVTVYADQAQNQVRIDYFNASPTQVSNGGYTSLSWGTTGASSCSITNEGTVSTNGTRSVGPIFGTRSYTLTCYGTNGGSDSRTVTVYGDQTGGGSGYINSFTASPTQVQEGGYSTLYWNTTNMSSCTVDGQFVSANGSRSVGPIYGSRTYTLYCNSTNGGSDSRTLTITTFGNNGGNYPVINNFTASPLTVSLNSYSTLTWNSNADYCVASGNWSGNKSASGSESVGPITGTRTYTLTCYRGGNQVSQTVTVYVGNQNPGNRNDGAITNFPTRVLQTSAQLNGIGLSSEGRLVDGWFEWGRNTSFGNTTNIRTLGNAPTNSYSETVTGLSSNTTYYYRAVARTSIGTFYGDTMQFTTARVGTITPTPTPGPQATTTLTYGRPAFVEVIIEKLQSEATRGNEAEFRVTYRSLIDRTLENVLAKVALPEEFEYVSASRGVYAPENRTLTVNIGNLLPRQSDSFVVRVNVLPNAQVGKTVATTAYVNYTVPATSNFLAYQDEVIAYVLSTIRENGLNNAAAAGAFGLPGNLIGWLLLLVILLAIIYLLRKLYLSFQEYKQAK